MEKISTGNIINIIIYIVLTLTVAFTTMFFLTYKKKLEEKAGLQFKNQMERHYEEVNNIYMEMRGWRHDFHNHIQTMKGHIALGQETQLDEYLNSLDADLEQVNIQIKTGNVMVDAIINSKVSLAESRNIAVNVRAHADENIATSDIDLCVIMGNLVDNAIDACLEIEDIQKRFIRIYMGKLKDQLYISVTNSTAEKKKNITGIYLSKKGGMMHGHGLKRVDAAVAKYGGYINRQNEPEVFATEILLPI